MARRRSRIPLDVRLNSRLMGQLRRESSGVVDFRYDPSWLAWEHAIPISLSLPLREDRYIGDPVTAVLDNLLPDHEPIRRRMAERVQADGYDAYSLLARIGRDCVGALQFLPEKSQPEPVGSVEGRPVDAPFIARKLGDLGASPLGVDDENGFRISIAGAQEKTALLLWRGRWHVPHGTTPTTHILKPQIGVLPNGLDLSRRVENELLCMRLAAAFGLPTARVDVADFDGTRALVIERFDRRWTEDGRLLRVPQEDCCQALSVPPTLKYEPDGGPGLQQILELLKGSDEPLTDRRLFLKAQMMFWLLGATDGHAKNLSLFLRPGGRFVLTPLYDIMSAQPAVDARRLRRNEMKLAMAIGDSRYYVVDRIMPRHFIQSADRGGMSGREARDLLTELADVCEGAVRRALSSLPPDFPEDLADSVTRGLRKRLRLVEAEPRPAGEVC